MHGYGCHDAGPRNRVSKGMPYAEWAIASLGLLLIAVGLCFIASASWYFGKVWALRRVTRGSMKERGYIDNGSTSKK